MYWNLQDGLGGRGVVVVEGVGVDGVDGVVVVGVPNENAEGAGTVIAAVVVVGAAV